MTDRAPSLLRAAVVGARRERQGTGEFIARALAKQGVRVESIVGTRPETAEQARVDLKERHGIDARAHLSLEELLAKEKPDIVVIASPAEYHLPALEAALQAGCHVFCEK